ncbi:hypothetical protein TNCV_3564211 [Trichonephila clavipes]|nr:hypothetical protein TNCV_3564211 [Trichonephila clavipes]
MSISRLVLLTIKSTKQQVETFIWADRRVTVNSIATAKRCSHGLAYSIMYDRLNFQKKQHLGGKQCADDEGVQHEVLLWMRQQAKEFYAAGIEALIKRWDKCINVASVAYTKVSGLSKSEDFINELLDDTASVINLTEEERQERILRKKGQMNRE